MFELRKYQEVLSNNILSHFSGNEIIKLMSQLPTGGGKTVVLGYVLKELSKKFSGKVLVVVHRERLVEQISETLSAFGIDNIKLTADSPPVWMNKNYKKSKANVCMVQTLGSRIKKNPDYVPSPEEVSLIIYDEAHRTGAKTYTEIIKYYKNASILGFTATPIRTDDKKLSDIYTTGIEVGPSTAQLMSLGALCSYQPYKVHAVPYNKLKNIIKESKSQRALDRNMSSIIEEYDVLTKVYKFWNTFCIGKPTIIFASDRIQGMECYNLFKSKGVKCVYIDGDTLPAKREEIDADLKDGKYEVFINVMLATEGYDAPLLEACLILRSSYSLGLYLQMVGRVLRKYIGKKEAIIADFGGNMDRFGMPDREHPWEDYFYGTKKPMSFFGDVINKNLVEVDLSGEQATKRNTGKMVSSMLNSVANQVKDEKLRERLKTHASGEIQLSKIVKEMIKLREEIPESRIVLQHLKKTPDFDNAVTFNQKVTPKARVIIDKASSKFTKEESNVLVDEFISTLKGIPTIFEILYLAKKLNMKKEEALNLCKEVGFEHQFIEEVVSPYTKLAM